MAHRMTESMEKVFQAIDKLSKQSGTLDEYEDLHIMLRNMKRNDLADAVTRHNLLDIFAHIDLSSGAFSEVALNIAVSIFSTFRLTEFVHTHENELLMSITAKNLPLRDFVISRLTDGVKNSPPEDLDIPKNILLEISKIAVSEDINSAASARAFLLAFGIYNPDGVKTLLEESSTQEYFGSITRDEEIVRFSEIFAEIASKRRETLRIMLNKKVFDRLMDIVKKDDPLLQLNTLAVLKILLQYHDGRTYLQSNGVVGCLLSSLQNMEHNILRNALLPGYLSFFATLAEEEPTDFLSNPMYQQSLINCFSNYLSNSSDTVIIIAVIEAIAQICRTLDGKKSLATYLVPNGCLAPLFAKCAVIMQNASSDVLPRILYAVADMLRMPLAVDETTPDISALIPAAQITQQWFIQLESGLRSSRLLLRIWDLAKQPFKEIRAGALSLLRAIASEPWGLTMFGNQPGFLDYLFDPSTEVGTAQDGSSLQPEKFRVIQQCECTQELWKARTDLWSLLNNETATRLQVRVKDGVWGHMRAQANVAMENE